MDRTEAAPYRFLMYFFVSFRLEGCEVVGDGWGGGLCWESLDALGIRGKMRRKRCGNAGKKVSSRRLLETSVSTQTPVAGRRRERRALVCGGPGPGISGAAQLGRAALFICPDLAFAPRLRDLLSERRHCPAGKICYKYLPWGGSDAKPMACSQPDQSCKNSLQCIFFFF